MELWVRHKEILISTIFLYDEPKVPEINIERLACFLKEQFAVNIQTRQSIFKNLTDATAKELASIRIFKPKNVFQRHEPTFEEIESEIRCKDTENIIYYDGFQMQKIITDLIPEEELLYENLHIVFTNRLTCTYDYSD